MQLSEKHPAKMSPESVEYRDSVFRFGFSLSACVMGEGSGSHIEMEFKPVSTPERSCKSEYRLRNRYFRHEKNVAALRVPVQSRTGFETGEHTALAQGCQFR
jgi:hypothetical protein